MKARKLIASADPLERWRGHLKVIAAASSEEARAAYRRRVTEGDPMLFALMYLRHHLKASDGAITLSEVHLEWARSAERWALPSTEPYADRRAEVAPREMGKSTWHFLILPMWGAAHEHIRFAAAFADTGTQAETHLASFKAELDNNPLLRADFPDLVAPKTRGRGTVEADRVSLYHARNGFVFAAAGMDSSNLGLKVGNARPDLIILDDMEPHEARYSAALASKRLDTLTSAILPLNIYAHVIAVGTVTMGGSIMHQLVQATKPDAKVEEWVRDERFTARHWLPILVNDDGTSRSVWPAKWSLAFLESIRHTRAYAKNYANDPIGADGDFWSMDDIRKVAEFAGVTRTMISIDPAVTTKATSDFTGIAVVGYSPSLGKCIVLGCWQVKLDPEKLRLRVLKILEGIDSAAMVYVETNQGGDLWPRILWGMPVPVKTVHQSVAKEVRAADALNHYQRGRVVHAEGADLAALEGQLVAFPNAPHDDMVDAVTSAVRYFFRKRIRRTGVGGEAVPYAA
jgi:predicted phage terminase large subunit-like protein